MKRRRGRIKSEEKKMEKMEMGVKKKLKAEAHVVTSLNGYSYV